MLLCLCVQMFSMDVPYLAVTEVQAEYPEQLSVLQEQPLRVLDSKRSDWWLVSSIPEPDEEEDMFTVSEGWIKASLLQPGESWACLGLGLGLG